MLVLWEAVTCPRSCDGFSKDRTLCDMGPVIMRQIGEEGLRVVDEQGIQQHRVFQERCVCWFCGRQ